MQIVGFAMQRLKYEVMNKYLVNKMSDCAANWTKVPPITSFAVTKSLTVSTELASTTDTFTFHVFSFFLIFYTLYCNIYMNVNLYKTNYHNFSMFVCADMHH